MNIRQVEAQRKPSASPEDFPLGPAYPRDYGDSLGHNGDARAAVSAHNANREISMVAETVSDELIEKEIAGLTDPDFPSSRELHYCFLAKVLRNPEHFCCSQDAKIKILRLLNNPPELEVQHRGEMLYQTWANDVATRVAAFLDKPK